MNGNTLMGQEWQTLQNNHERYEIGALLIKLVCLGLCVAGLAAHLDTGWIGAVVLLCWVEEGIFKTYQARLADRLLQLESLIRQAAPSARAMQLYSEWSAARPGGLGLLREYAASTLRPTVAFPYAPILFLGGVVKMLM